MTFPRQSDPFSKYLWSTEYVPGQSCLEHCENTSQARSPGQTLTVTRIRRENVLRPIG